MVDRCGLIRLKGDNFSVEKLAARLSGFYLDDFDRMKRADAKDLDAIYWAARRLDDPAAGSDKPF